MERLAARLAGLLPLVVLALAAPLCAQVDYVADLQFAIDELETQCGALLRTKEIDWRKTTAPLLEDAKAVHNESEYGMLLKRLLARLHDGHAEVQPGPAAGKLEWPAPDTTGPGMFWCKSGGKLYIKNVWNDSEKLGLQPGMELLEVDGQPAMQWLEQRIAKLSDLESFSTPQQAFFFACHWGLADPPGTKRALVVKKPKGKKTERELVYGKANPVPWGPAYPPAHLKPTDDTGDVNYGLTDKKWGYIQIRRCKEALPEQMDKALAAIGSVKGLILDFRANGGGGFDHAGFMGRFVPAEHTYRAEVEYPSAGPNPYGGPIVAIVDGNVRSAGETAAGLFKDDGRGYVIGESATAGMSSQKTTIELPSKLFALYVSVASNKGRYNGGKGLEGIGVIPHRIVEYEPTDLEEKVDTLIRVAEEILAKFPQKDVRYDPKEFGWKK